MRDGLQAHGDQVIIDHIVGGAVIDIVDELHAMAKEPTLLVGQTALGVTQDDVRHLMPQQESTLAVSRQPTIKVGVDVHPHAISGRSGDG